MYLFALVVAPLEPLKRNESNLNASLPVEAMRNPRRTIISPRTEKYSSWMTVRMDGNLLKLAAVEGVKSSEALADQTRTIQEEITFDECSSRMPISNERESSSRLHDDFSPTRGRIMKIVRESTDGQTNNK
mmetsp:Transcript_6565/g.15969  ORF Transcript_6565/g.15969 Transcript_6565/m.15969 type:complete len:131 (+) Transcript_6565:935-1327(+)